MLKMVVGYSEDVDDHDAIAEALDQASAQLDGLQPAAAVLFAGVDYEHEPITEAVLKRYPDINLIGCVADGQMSSESGYVDDGVTLTLFASDVLDITAGLGQNVSAAPVEASRAAAEEAMAGTDKEPALAIAFTDLLQSDLGAVVESLAEVLGRDVPVVGGASAAEDIRATPWLSHQFYGAEVMSDSLPLLLFSGPLKISASVAHGWTPTGKPAIVTQAERNRVGAVGEESVIDYYRSYIGDDLGFLMANPLAVSQGDSFVLRSVTGTDEEDGTASFMGEVPEGATVQVSMTTVPDILDAASYAVSDALANFPGPGKPEGAFLVSCAVRKMLLGSRAGDEAEAARDQLGRELPMMGFYAWAEIGPLADGLTRLHNATFVTLLIGT
ncbi:MAG: FIST signal transduction protein [Acidimicrobiia bacterium]